MKKLILLITILFYCIKSFAFTLPVDSTVKRSQPLDSAVKQSQPVMPVLDGLLLQVQGAITDSVRSGLYSQIAHEYLKYDSLSAKKRKLYQTQALNYSYKALHLYSKMHDTLGLRDCYNGLAKVYKSQKKYPQAKWFILQSNSLSRAKKDIPNIMSSLIVLANIKMEIEDYTLAMHDLDEVLKLSKANHDPKAESNVQENYAMLYSHLQNYTKATLAQKRHDFIEDSLLKKEQQAIAKTQDTLQTKKKFIQVSRKVYKSSSSKRIASI